MKYPLGYIQRTAAAPMQKLGGCEKNMKRIACFALEQVKDGALLVEKAI